MTTTGLEAFDKTVHKANEWLAELTRRLEVDDRRQAYAALRAVLHALRDRLPTVSVATLGAQLPVLVRGVYYDGWHPKVDGSPRANAHSVDDFLALVERDIPPGKALDPERAARAVFGTLDNHLDPSEADKVRHLLPRPIQSLWGPETEPRDT